MSEMEVSQGWFPRPVSLACGWLSSPRVLMQSSCCACPGPDLFLISPVTLD